MHVEVRIGQKGNSPKGRLEMRSASDASGVMIKCFCCGREFRMGPGRYDGTRIPKYEISVCSTCYASNWDGWVDTMNDRLVRHLTERELPIPEKNKAGWLPRDG
jgi:hypothetical protein